MLKSELYGTPDNLLEVFRSKLLDKVFPNNRYKIFGTKTS